MPAPSSARTHTSQAPGLVNASQNYLLIFVRAQRTAAPLAETSRSSPGGLGPSESSTATSRPGRDKPGPAALRSRHRPQATPHTEDQPAAPTVRLQGQDEPLLPVQLLRQPTGRLQTGGGLRQLRLHTGNTGSGGRQKPASGLVLTNSTSRSKITASNAGADVKQSFFIRLTTIPK